ncbi:MAG: hypothetical protein KatS3mg085_108 [Candidatus Dojkabacteria bacterium]|nr:MAG: hypothetical protein KatS3mg085_108 [Candidatus Dojkabacteria bacterium]
MSLRTKARIAAFILLILGLAGIVLAYPSSEDDSFTQEKVEMNKSLDKALDNSEISDTNSQTNAFETRFLDYDDELLQLANEYKIVLFFHADWCPTCLALERDINRNIDSIPQNVLILKAPYGNNGETELAQKYNVKVQHTLIQLDNEAKPKKTWVGSFRLEEVISELV